MLTKNVNILKYLKYFLPWKLKYYRLNKFFKKVF